MSRRELERITRVWQARLHLGDWEITPRWALPVARGFDAEIKIHDHHEQASLRFGWDYKTWDVEKANRTIVHELLHIFEHETRKVAMQVPLVRTSGDLWWNWYCTGAERWVEKLAAAIYELGGNA